ncbi:hypothetical protein [Hymenobacter cellulosivorans]|uniref:SdpC family antimicrobial peptide n=1 Tax=Hymenobacter cellulosivorans TaxID=2932249 RepID=A0ABY4FFS9_9BACT|nr:hypothetical protein [Hymenobacter cellulosivorans]UOQ55395.1 hypothetical protein MUN80_11710 [Hymenobacter cellulosivorans]
MFAYLRKSTSVKALSLLAVGTSLMMSCSKDQVQPSAPVEHHAASAAAYSGEELFQGIFLMQGDVAARIPYFAPLRSAIAKNLREHPEQQQKRQQAAERVTQLIKHLEPGYFAELKAAITSQNFNRIEESLRKGAALHKTVILSLSSSAQRTQQAELLKQLDMSKYDFRKQEDLERYMADAKALSAHAATEAGVADQLEQGLVIDEGVVIVVAYWQIYAWSLYAAIILPTIQSPDSQVSTVMQQRADLEKEKLVRDLAFLASGQHN